MAFDKYQLNSEKECLTYIIIKFENKIIIEESYLKNEKTKSILRKILKKSITSQIIRPDSEYKKYEKRQIKDVLRKKSIQFDIINHIFCTSKICNSYFSIFLMDL